MPGFNNSGKAVMLGALRTAITHISLHTASPGTTGLNEVSGGDEPAYSRKSVQASDWTAVDAGSFELDADKDLEFRGPNNGDCTHFGIWGSGPTFYGGGAITGDTKFNAEGDFILKAGTSIDLNAT